MRKAFTAIVFILLLVSLPVPSFSESTVDGSHFVVLNISKSGINHINNVKFNILPDTDILKLKFSARRLGKNHPVSAVRVEILKSTVPYNNKYWLSDSQGEIWIPFTKNRKVIFTVPEIELTLLDAPLIENKLENLLKPFHYADKEKIDGFISRSFECLLTREDFQLEIYMKNMKDFIRIAENFLVMRNNYMELLKEFNMFLKIIGNQLNALEMKKTSLEKNNIIMKNAVRNSVYNRFKSMMGTMLFKKIQLLILRIPVYHDELTYICFNRDRKFNYFKSWVEEIRFGLINQLRDPVNNTNVLYSSFRSFFDTTISLFIEHGLSLFNHEIVLNRNCFEGILHKIAIINESLIKEISESKSNHRYIQNYLKSNNTDFNSGNIQKLSENIANESKKTIKNMPFSLVEGKINIFSDMMEDVFGGFPDSNAIIFKEPPVRLQEHVIVPNRLLFSDFGIYFNRNLINMINLLESEEKFSGTEQIISFENSFTFVSQNSVLLLDILAPEYWKMNQPLRDLYQKYLREIENLEQIELEFLLSTMNGEPEKFYRSKLAENYRKLILLFPSLIEAVSDNNLNNRAEFYIHLKDADGGKSIELTYLGALPIEGIQIYKSGPRQDVLLKKFPGAIVPGQKILLEIKDQSTKEFFIRIADDLGMTARYFFIPSSSERTPANVVKDLNENILGRFFCLGQSIFLYYSSKSNVLPLISAEFFINGDKCEYKVHGALSKIEIIPAKKISSPRIDFSLRAEYQPGKFAVITRTVDFARFDAGNAAGFFWSGFAFFTVILIAIYVNHRRKYFNIERLVSEIKEAAINFYAPIIKYRVNRLYEYLGKLTISCFERGVLSAESFADMDHWGEALSLYDEVQQESKKIIELEKEKIDMFDIKKNLEVSVFNTLYSRLQKLELEIETATEEIDMTAYKLGVLSYRFFREEFKHYPQLEKAILQIEDLKGLSEYRDGKMEGKDTGTA